ncbi:MAG: hypothetical protein Athens071424_42 [Parcubacteria group bacterium Athens0714_24]|nr:MAG: hypothetical protein Athens071424_42 [Parcubacteria group bacterium Athens0714_24]
MGAIAAEIARAKTWQNQDQEKFLSAIERGLELIDSSIDDDKWRGWRSMLFGLRNELANFYLNNSYKDINILYTAI